MGEWPFGQLIGQNNKVVHWPARLSDTVELQLIIQVVIRETTVLSTCRSDSTPFFRCFDPHPGSSAGSMMREEMKLCLRENTLPPISKTRLLEQKSGPDILVASFFPPVSQKIPISLFGKSVWQTSIPTSFDQKELTACLRLSK
jgi:hypothetical protein